MMKIDSNVFLCVCCKRMEGVCHRAPDTVIHLRIFWEPAVSHSVEKEEQGR